MVQPLPREDGALLERMAACGAALIGPGLGRAAETEARVLYLLERLQIPVVLDADGINAVSALIDGSRGVIRSIERSSLQDFLQCTTCGAACHRA